MFSSVDVGVDVSPERVVLGEVRWRRGKPDGVGRWAEYLRLSDPKVGEVSEADIDWVRATLATWRCRPRSVAVTVEDGWVRSDRLSVPVWLTGDDLEQALRDDWRGRWPDDGDSTVMDFMACQADFTRSMAGPSDEPTVDMQTMDVFGLPEHTLQKQLEYWSHLGAPVERVEPQSIALARGMAHLLGAEQARLLVDVQVHGVLCVWSGSTGGFGRLWVPAETMDAPVESLALGVLPVTDDGDTAWWAAPAVEAVNQAVSGWVSEDHAFDWCVRGAGPVAQSVRLALRRWFNDPVHRLRANELVASAWPAAATAWGVALVREV